MDVQRADPGLRLVALAVVLVALVAGVILFLALQHELAELRRLPPAAAQARLLTVFAWALGIACCALAGLAAVLWRSGTRVLHSGQWPPPGVRVIRDTPVLRGPAAHFRARLLQGLGATLLLGAIGVAVAAWRLYHAFSAAVV